MPEIDAGLFSGMARDSAADFFGAENLAKDIIAFFNRCWFGRDNAVEQTAAAQLTQQTTKAVQARRLRLCSLFKPAQNRGQQSLRTHLRDLFVHAQLLCDRTDCARLF